ncbi:MAG: hypothetical protein MUC35_04580 [Candidatus Margulisbacteria bacterium]|jgi:hypothetical protein|nr:hypothetical protein [Candidatus Margulisiibacteriota bacterium]
MKKMFVYFLVVAFVLSIAGAVFGRTLEEERDAVRAYLKVVDAKIIKYRKAGNKAKMVVLQKEKQATLARWNKLKASMESAAPAVTPPPPPPVAPAPAPAVSAAPSGGLFGMGINTCLTGAYINTGKGSISGSVGAMASIVLDDFVGLGPMVGLGAKSINYTVGLGGFYGGGGLKAIPVRAGGIINLPAEWMGGLESYLAGGLNYVAYGNGQKAGKIGGDAAVGFKADLGLGLGKTGFELGYSVVRSDTVSAKGLSLAVSQPIVL